MRTKASLWFWSGVWAVSLLVGLGVFVLYAWLPADGATGDLESFTSEGFRVQWLLEEREGGLRVEDVIVRAGGHTVEEWLSGAPRGPEWRNGGVVTYEILRDGQTMTLPIRLAPTPFGVILRRWASQLVLSLILLVIGTYIFWKRPYETPARLLMLFCITITVQFWGDAYYFQCAALPWRWPFWFHLILEQGTFMLTYAAIFHFTLLFPATHPLIERFPRLTVAALYAANPLIIAVVMALSPTWSEALVRGNHAILLVAVAQVGLGVGAGLRSVRTARDPVSRAQIRWILWGVSVVMAVVIPGYLLPLALTGRPFIPYPVIMLFNAFIPCISAVAILRYRVFDIEIIINRTLVYGTLTALLGGLYLLLVRLLTLLVQGVLHRENDTLVVFVATLSIALAFMPLRQRVQALIDRTFYRIKLDYQRLLPEMSERLATSIVPDQLAALLTGEVPERLQIAWATLTVLDPAGEHFVLAGAGNSRSTLPVDHPLVESLHRMGRPLLRLQPPPHLPAEAQAFLDQHSIELSIPLIVGTELVGLYNLGPKLSGDTYNRYEVRLLHLLGQQAAVAVENSRLFQAEREQRRLTEALKEAAEIVSSTLDLDRVLDCILEQVERVVAGDAFNIMLIERGIARVVRWRGYERLGVAGQMASFSILIAKYPTLTEMIRAGKPIVVPDTATNPGWVPLEGWEWLRSYVSAPIRVAGLEGGFLNVDGTRPGQFGPGDAQGLEAFAHHAATALENAKLYEDAQQELAERKRAEEELRQSYLQLQRALEGTVHTLVSAIEMKDPYTAGHQRRVTRLACAIANEMDLPEEQTEGIRMAGLIHDLGKISVPAQILSKPGRLSDLEFGLIKAHVQVGYDILNGAIDFPWPLARIVLQHHERMDGSGYPAGLLGEEILLEARILAVADVVAAMASHRPYRLALTISEALEEISQNSGVLYDPEVVDACLRIFTEKEFKFE